MLRHFLDHAERIVLHRPRTVLVVALALVAVSGWLGSGIELRTARADLVPEGDPSQARWVDLRREFDGAEPLIVVLEAGPAEVSLERLEAAASAVGEALESEPLADGIFYRIDLDWLERNLLWLAPPADLERGLDRVAELLADEAGSIEIGGFAALNGLVAGRIESSLAAGSVLPSDDTTAEAESLVLLLEAQNDFLADPEGFLGRLGDRPLQLLAGDELGALTSAGYLATRDQGALFLLVSSEGGDLDDRRRLVTAVRESIERTLTTHPGLRYGLTGPPAMEVEEMNSIGRDGWRTSMFAIAGVLILSLLAFQRRRHALMGLGTLAIGTVWSLGAVQIELGYLNMITTSLIPILVGMGVGYAVHLLSQYEIERQDRDRESAVRITYRTTTAAVTVSALTTAAAFFCFLFMRFRGFSELGLVTGVGVVLCLVASLSVLPALLMLRGVGGAALGHGRKEHAVVDRVWNRVTAVRVCRFPRAVVAVAAVATVASALAATGVKLDSSILELLPAGAESLRYLERMNQDSALSNDLNIVVADDLEELEVLEGQAMELGSIERFESILSFLPAEPEASGRALRRAETVLAAASIDRGGSSPAAWRSSLGRLEAALAEAADAAFVTGLGELSGVLERARQQAEQAVGRAADEDPRRAEVESELLERLSGLVDTLRAGASAPAPTLDILPAAITERFVTNRGRYLGYLHPAGDIYDPEFLASFNAESLAVSDSAIGFPVLFGEHSLIITDGFEVAFAIGGGVIFVLLLIGFRHPVYTLLALAPVVLGTVWMLGLMRLLDLDFNFANLIAVPIVLGVGIDGGVHVVQRFRLEGATGLITVVAHTGRAVLIASLTTMVGFGSLALATHRGMASLGMLLLVGVGTSLVATLVFLPNLLLALGLARR